MPTRRRGPRYERIRKLCLPLFPQFPSVLPAEGLIAESDDGKRLGVWIMPDNRSPGDLETFLRSLVPPEQDALWNFACTSVAEARQLGAPCREVHLAKANLYTWLAWQDPPIQRPGLALRRDVLASVSEDSKAFVRWFLDLYPL